MGRLLATCSLTLLSLSCATHSERVALPSAVPRIDAAARTQADAGGQPWEIRVVLRGAFPRGPLILRVTGESRLFLERKIDVDVSRYYRYHINFLPSFWMGVNNEQQYFRLLGLIEGEAWDGFMKVEIVVHGIQYTSTTGWTRGEVIASRSVPLRLTCWACTA